MLNLLIIDKDVNNSMSLLNYISKNSNQVKVHSIVNNLTDGIKVLNTGLVDITIINLDCDLNTILVNLSLISDIYSEKYRKSMIIINNHNNIYSNPFIYTYMNSMEELSVIFLKIKEIVKIKLNELNDLILLDRIKEELKYIGYNFAHYGSRYLAESIAIIYNNYDSSENLNKHVYPILAQRHHKSINTIKGDIRTATNSMYYDCDENRLKKYFNFYTISKPQPKLVIYTVLSKLYKTIWLIKNTCYLLNKYFLLFLPFFYIIIFYAIIKIQSSYYF